ncbi:thioesterase family protein [Pseudomonas silvicola]|nr:thioesterase family protein [Pseudomonas silvicola]
MYGGQSLGIACAAALETTDKALQPTALQLNFLAPGMLGLPLHLRVERVQQTRRFATRLIHIEQGNRTIAVATVALHTGEAGYVHASPCAQAIAPEELMNLAQLREHYFDRLNPIEQLHIGRNQAVEVRPLDPERFLLERNPQARHSYWIRTSKSLDLEPRLHSSVLAYLSDSWLGLTALTPHRVHKLGNDLYVSSLNHSMWFHEQGLRADGWLLVRASSPWAGQGRGLSLASVHDRHGKLLATLAQEGLYRQR